MPFSIAEVVNDPDFAQTFTIVRSNNGRFVMGKWVNNTIKINAWGSLQPPTPEELEMVPEGDRVTGVVAVHTSMLIYETNVQQGGISDIVNWHGQDYRVMKVFPWQDYGYYKALAVRMSGQ
jgi:hypothetical protein